MAESKAELLSLQQVRCFCAALELGSFSAAADALRVSQPAVAEQVRKLERALGADLFVRAGRGVLPTDAGLAFADHAAESLRALEDAADSVGEFTAMRSGRVALGTFSAPSTWRFEEVVAAFLERHPNMTVRFLGRNSSAIAERVRRGELEAGVVLLPIDDDRLEVRPLVRDEVLYVSADPERTRRPATIERLASRAADLLRRRVGRQRPDPPAARRACAGARRSPAPARGGGDGRARARPRRARARRHLSPRLLHARAVLPRRADHGAFTPALYNTFAIVTRPAARLSPGTRELLAELETHMHAVAGEFDRSR